MSRMDVKRLQIEIDQSKLQTAIDAASEALRRTKSNQERASIVRQTMDDRYGPAWSCITGMDFGRMARICRWRYTPECENYFVYSSDTCINDFTCTCMKLGNCLTACALEECFENCRPWSHWSDTCGFVFSGDTVRRNRSRICLCDTNDATYLQKNINDTCWQYSTCETRWEIYRLFLFVFALLVIINLVAFMGAGILAYLHPPSAERGVPGFNVNPVESDVGMAEDISVHEEDLTEKI